jgi:hypothetical protein
MDQPRRTRNSRLLWGLILLATAYGGWFYFPLSLTGTALLDGSIGIVLGLYICSHPAANAVDMLFFERSAPWRRSTPWSNLGWLALNLLTLLAGWVVIVIGAARFASPGA